eukprot:1823800-Lingulodinium_polyedra.AAC.1
MVWPLLQWPRELLLNLEGCKFQAVPEESVGKPLKQFTQGWPGTKFVEDMVHIAKSAKMGIQSG